MHKLESAEAYVRTISDDEFGETLLLGRKESSRNREARPVQGRDNSEVLYFPDDRAQYYPKLEHIKQAKPHPKSITPRYDDALARHQLSYLNGGGSTRI